VLGMIVVIQRMTPWLVGKWGCGGVMGLLRLWVCDVGCGCRCVSALESERMRRPLLLWRKAMVDI